MTRAGKHSEVASHTEDSECGQCRVLSLSLEEAQIDLTEERKKTADLEAKLSETQSQLQKAIQVCYDAMKASRAFQGFSSKNPPGQLKSS